MQFPVKVNTNVRLAYSFDTSIEFLENVLRVPESYYGVILDNTVMNPSSSVKPSDEYLTEAEMTMPVNVSNVLYKEEEESIIKEDEELLAALFEQTQKKNLEGVKRIFEKGKFDPNVEFDSKPLLEVASSFGSSDIVTWLVDTKHANILGRFDESGITPYSIALEKGFPDLAESLLTETLRLLYTKAIDYFAAEQYEKTKQYCEEALKIGQDREGMSVFENMLGELYAGGLGVDIDYGKARQLFESAAAKDNPKAMAHLGFLYQYGFGVPKNLQTAKKYFEKAIAEGNEIAKDQLGEVNKEIAEETVIPKKEGPKFSDINSGWEI